MIFASLTFFQTLRMLHYFSKLTLKWGLVIESVLGNIVGYFFNFIFVRSFIFLF